MAKLLKEGHGRGWGSGMTHQTCGQENGGQENFQTPAALIFLPLIFLPNSAWDLQTMKRGRRVGMAANAERPCAPSARLRI
jgi:hypothetical protein